MKPEEDGLLSAFALPISNSTDVEMLVSVQLMKWILPLALILGVECWLGGADAIGSKANPVSFDFFTNGYSEYRFPTQQPDEGLSLAVFTEPKTFGPAVVSCRISGTSVPTGYIVPRDLPTNAFETNIIAAVVHRTNKLFSYQVEKVEADEKVAVIHFRTEERAFKPLITIGVSPQQTAIPIPSAPKSHNQVNIPPLVSPLSPVSNPPSPKPNASSPQGNYSSLLLVLLPRGEFSSVKFVENNKPIGDVAVPPKH